VVLWRSSLARKCAKQIYSRDAPQKQAPIPRATIYARNLLGNRPGILNRCNLANDCSLVEGGFSSA
jgi:hypothetical protein